MAKGSIPSASAIDGWIGFVCPVHGEYDPADYAIGAPMDRMCPTVIKCHPVCPRQRDGYHCVYCEHRFGKES